MVKLKEGTLACKDCLGSLLPCLLEIVVREHPFVSKHDASCSKRGRGALLVRLVYSGFLASLGHLHSQDVLPATTMLKAQ